jgi:hypothetical protein
MVIYKIVFAKKMIISCEPVNAEISLEGNYNYQHQNGEPIYAFVKADSPPAAIKIAHDIINEVQNSPSGDYI